MYFKMLPSVLYNTGSVIFYLVLLCVIHKKRPYRIAVTVVHLEVSVFVVFSTMMGGAGLGFSTYMLAMASLVYFCPFKHKRIPYLFSIGELLVYMLLTVFTNKYFFPSALIQGDAKLALNIYNACICFMIILLSAYLSDASAAVSRERLTNENKRLNRIANYDRLTGLQSRYMFLKRLKSYGEDKQMAMCIGDIDDFKHINDTYGHVCGDYVLQHIAEIMRKNFNLNEVDICRWGGEEFVFLFHNNSFNEAYAKVEELRKKIEEFSFEFENTRIDVTMTFGLADGEGRAINTALLEKADKMLYKGKKNGKNTVVKA
jgi:diguanylate cyclase (GGDEF)-like protein